MIMLSSPKLSTYLKRVPSTWERMGACRSFVVGTSTLYPYLLSCLLSIAKILRMMKNDGPIAQERLMSNRNNSIVRSTSCCRERQITVSWSHFLVTLRALIRTTSAQIQSSKMWLEINQCLSLLTTKKISKALSTIFSTPVNSLKYAHFLKFHEKKISGEKERFQAPNSPVITLESKRYLP